MGSSSFYAVWELIYTFVDFGAASTFLIGSVLFAFKPTIRTWRDIKLASMGHVEELENKKE